MFKDDSLFISVYYSNMKILDKNLCIFVFVYIFYFVCIYEIIFISNIN